MGPQRVLIELTDEEYWAVLGNDFSTFTERSFCDLNPDTEYRPNWHHELMAAKLEACGRGETKRLIINVPPRSGKSQCVNVGFTAYLLGRKPSVQKQKICAPSG
jgi:hypothetical protein